MLCCIIAVSVTVNSYRCNDEEDVPTRGSLETTSTYVFLVKGSMTTQHPSNLASNPVNSSAVRLTISLCEIYVNIDSSLASLSKTFDRIRDLFEPFAVQSAHTSLNLPRVQIRRIGIKR
jgi:hypothetical protein